MSLRRSLGLGPRELVAFVGAGGKSTLLFATASEGAATGSRVLVTTTTKMGRDQFHEVTTIRWTGDLRPVDDALAGAGPVALIASDDGHKVTGPTPVAVDAIFGSGVVDLFLVEADGARGRSIKAPASHEPVVPRLASTVVAVMGADALGQPIRRVAHRPRLVARLASCSEEDLVTPQVAAAILEHRQGGLRHAPPSARIVVAVTGRGSDGAEAHQVAELVDRLRRGAVVDGAVAIPDLPA